MEAGKDMPGLRMPRVAAALDQECHVGVCPYSPLPDKRHIFRKEDEAWGKDGESTGLLCINHKTGFHTRQRRAAEILGQGLPQALLAMTPFHA